MTYEQFMNTVYIPYYQTEVEESTFSIKQKNIEKDKR